VTSSAGVHLSSEGDPPEISVVVISVGARAQLADAVLSLLAQSSRAEILVINSGGGDAAGLLRTFGAEVPVYEIPGVAMVGAARNEGIRRARAPIVAFLAEDCLATPGWIEQRLLAHLSGNPAVASALLNDRRRNPIAWAAHLSLFYRRLPHTPAQSALAYGGSYDRALFARYGMFREDLRTGEDTEFNARLAEEDRPVWMPAIKTIHRNASRFWEMLRDQHVRGKRFAIARREISGASRVRILLELAKGTVPKMICGLAWVRGVDRFVVLAAWPLLPFATIAYASGVLSAGRTRRSESPAPAAAT
jgi:glycosyltransferase involved in cell wall biosynthesis